MTRLGELLQQAGKVSEEQLNQALAAQQSQGGRVGSHLVKMGFIDDEDYIAAHTEEEEFSTTGIIMVL